MTRPYPVRRRSRRDRYYRRQRTAALVALCLLLAVSLLSTGVAL